MGKAEQVLRELLAERYGDVADQRRVMSDAGIPASKVSFATRAVNTWHAILEEAGRRDRVGALIEVVLADYVDDAQLRAVAAAYVRERDGESRAAPRIARRELHELILTMFRGQELRWLVAQFDPDLVYHIAWDRSLADAVFQLIQALEARGRLGRDFFELLLLERPGRAREIERVAAASGIELSAAPAVAATATTPARLVCVLADADTGAYSQLASHTAPLQQRGLLTIVAVHTAAELGAALDTADLVLVLLSVELLGSELGLAMGARLESLPERTSYLSVVLRACLWSQSTFGARRPLFSEPIASSPSPDRLWAELAARIAATVEGGPGGFEPTRAPGEESTPAPRHYRLDAEPGHFRIEAPEAHLTVNRATSTAPSADVEPTPVPSVPIHQIFSATDTPRSTLVETQQLKDAVYELTNLRKVLVLEGPSGTGKTSTYRAAIEAVRAAGGATWDETYFHGKHAHEHARLDALTAAPLGDAQGFIVVDDFHELDGERKQRVGRLAKSLLDLPTPSAKVVLIGINGIRSSLTAGLPDLAGGRTRAIRFGRQPDEVVAAMIGKGERAANVVFAKKLDVVADVRGSLMLAQLICEKLLLHQGIDRTSPTLRTVITPVHDIRGQLLDELRDQFHLALQDFALLDDGAPVRGAGIALLWSLGQTDGDSVALGDVRGWFADIDAAFDALLARVDQARRWRELLFCSVGDGLVALADPKLEFYLRQFDLVRFARDCGISIRLSAERGPVFLKTTRRPSDDAPPHVGWGGPSPGPTSARPPGGVVRILHLSDFHFRAGTSWDSTTVLGRLTEDVARLRQDGHKADLIVLTGDLAFSGQRDEYELVAKWIDAELLPAAELTPAELVIAPGNHDADRKAVGFAARAMQTSLLDNRRDADVAAVLANAAERQLLIGRHAGFVELLTRLGVGGRSWDLPWGAVTHDIRGVTIRTAAFCSSFMSCDDDDRGRLLLGLWQANDLLRDADDADLVVSAMHHPWSYFAEFDEAARHEVRRSSHIVLRGHLHDAEHEQLSGTGTDGVVEIAAGASYESSDHPNSYHFLSLDRIADEVRIRARMWNRKRRRWQADLNLFQGDFGRFPLRPRVARAR